MRKEKGLFKAEYIQNRIFTIRDIQVMVDRDLAELYQVPVKRLNEQVKRNIDRFPEEFRFQLNIEEKNKLVANCDRFKSLKHSSVNPYVFTEQGVAMLSAVLHSKIAVNMSILIMNAFVKIRKFITKNAGLFQRLEKVENKQIETNKNIEKIFDIIESREIQPKQGIFFEGQIFDAYKFISDLIKTAKKSIILIDNYIDESVLTLFTKRKKNILLTILTKKISEKLKLDVQKFNKQYPTVTLKKFSKAHDRFLIIDEKIVYHLGASLKDLGKKWFAFSKMDISAVDILKKAGELV